VSRRPPVRQPLVMVIDLDAGRADADVDGGLSLGSLVTDVVAAPGSVLDGVRRESRMGPYWAEPSAEPVTVIGSSFSSC
jgi:hypothetical protein